MKKKKICRHPMSHGWPFVTLIMMEFHFCLSSADRFASFIDKPVSSSISPVQRSVAQTVINQIQANFSADFFFSFLICVTVSQEHQNFVSAVIGNGFATKVLFILGSVSSVASVSRQPKWIQKEKCAFCLVIMLPYEYETVTSWTKTTTTVLLAHAFKCRR